MKMTISTNILESIEYTIRSLDNLISKKPTFLKKLTEIEKELEKNYTFKELYESSKEKYIVAVDAIYAKSIGALKNDLNVALQLIMPDKDYEVNVIIDDKRGTKTLEFTLLDKEQNLEVGLKNGVGQGVRTIISFVLKMYCLKSRGSKVLLLDEKYSALSSHYIPNFFQVMHTMCEKEGFIIVMITHDERFIDYANKHYTVNDGIVTLNSVLEGCDE